MIRKSFVFVLAALLVCCLLSGFAAAEETQEDPVPATPTDLECAHEHTKTTIYFYDSPLYTPVSGLSHRVSGPATEETVCLDCGEVLSSRTVNNAEEIRSHRMKNGRCVLCGYQEKSKLQVQGTADDLPGERTLFARAEEGTPGYLSLVILSEDLIALENAKINTVLVRGETGDAAIALQVEQMYALAKANEADLYLELEEQEDGSFFAAVALIRGSSEQNADGAEGISIRYYQEVKEPIRVSLAPANEDRLLETSATWDDHGFWSVPYVEEGTYFFLQ